LIKRFFFAISVCKTHFDSASKTKFYILTTEATKQINFFGHKTNRSEYKTGQPEGEKENLKDILGSMSKFRVREEGKAHGMFAFVIDL